MRAVERLFWANVEFDNSWRAHAASLGAVRLVSRLPTEMEPLLRTTMTTFDMSETGANSVFALESLLDELEFLKGEDFLPMRKNCLLGVCASFENFVKIFATGLSYEPDWHLRYQRYQSEGKTMHRSSGLLTQDTNADFDEKFACQDNAWRGKQANFLRRNFPWLKENDYATGCVEDVFWLRNQIMHNADSSKESKHLSFCKTDFVKGEKIVLTGELLSACVVSLREVVKWISGPTPYIEAF